MFPPYHKIFAVATALSFVAALPAVAAAQTTPVPSRTGVLRPQNATKPLDPKPRIEKILSVPALRPASIGVLIVSLGNGRTIYERNTDLALLPASNQKILTAVAALRLGATYRYTTALLRTGDIDKNGLLKGDLYLRGGGDPSLSSQRLYEMVLDLKKAGVRRIAGRIVGDATRFDNRVLGEGWEWDDEPFAYAPQISALNCDENIVEIEVTPGAAPGEPAVIRLGGRSSTLLGFENTPYIRLVNTATTGTGAEPTIAFDRARGRNDFSIAGSIPVGGKPVIGELTVEDPALFATVRLADLLAVEGVELPPLKNRRIETGKTPSDAVQIVQSQSLPLADLMRAFLKNSDNLYGEVLLKTVGDGTTARGAQIIRETLSRYNIDTAGWNTADGSGLSRHNTVTPRQLVGVLTAVEKQFTPEDRGMFQNALSIGGIDGTLRNRFKGTLAENNLRAKTGSLSGVSALSGYVTTRYGERLVFSILMNNTDSATARAAQDSIILALIDTPPPRK